MYVSALIREASVCSRDIFVMLVLCQVSGVILKESAEWQEEPKAVEGQENGLLQTKHGF